MSKDLIVAPASTLARLERHKASLSEPMTGAPMRGDPRLPNDARVPESVWKPQGLFERRICQYAAAMLTKRGVVEAESFEALDAIFTPPATVVFIRADASQAEIARYVVPDHVLEFDPSIQRSEP